jgi:hypothetical protein
MTFSQDAIGDARAAGYSDDEINAYLAPKMRQALDAGYSQDEINTYFGIKPQPPADIPQAFVDRVLSGAGKEQTPLGEGGLVGEIQRRVVLVEKRTRSADAKRTDFQID